MTHEYSSLPTSPTEEVVCPTTPASAARFHLTRLAVFVAVPSLALGGHPYCTADEAAAKLIVWSLAAEICGFATMSGPLGANHGLSTPLWFRLTPGTLKQPLLPGLPLLRSHIDIAVFCMYIASLAAALCAVGASQLTPRLRLSACLLSILCILDRSAYSGSKGDYYWTLLMCLAWAGVGEAEGITALQLVQLAHLLIPGVAKLGPWFAHVLPFFLSLSPLVPSGQTRSLRYDTARAARVTFAREPPQANREAFLPNARHLCPTFTAKLIAWLAGCTEVAVPILWCSERMSAFGVFLGCGMHISICLMLPPGAVLEWNAVNAALEVYLFGGCPHTAHGLLAALGGLGMPLRVFVAVVSWVGPICGHVWPDAMSNTFAGRKCAARSYAPLYPLQPAINHPPTHANTHQHLFTALQVHW